MNPDYFNLLFLAIRHLHADIFYLSSLLIIHAQKLLHNLDNLTQNYQSVPTVNLTYKLILFCL